MAIFDDQWFSGLESGLKGIAYAVTAAVVAVFAWRSQTSKTKVETSLWEKVQAERDAAVQRLEDILDAREKQFGACEERVRSLSEQVLDLKLALGRAMQEVARLDPPVADRLLQMQIRPGPPGKGDEPP